MINLKFSFTITPLTKLFVKFGVANSEMKRSKKIFFILVAIFLLIMMFIGYDISQRTTWPGAKKNLKERVTEPNGDEKK